MTTENCEFIRTLCNADVGTLTDFIEGVSRYVESRRPNIGRILMYYSAAQNRHGHSDDESEGGARATKKGGVAGPKWKALAPQISDFRNHVLLQNKFDLGTPLEWYQIRLLCYGGTEKTRSRNPYGLLGSFIIYMHDAFPDIVKRAHVLLPTDDVLVLEQMLGFYNWLKSRSAASAGDAPEPFPDPAAPSGGGAHVPPMSLKTHDVEQIRRHIAGFFEAPPEAQRKLNEYFSAARSGDKRYAHMICYRHQLNNPLKIIKSFLAIVPPEHNLMTSSYTFHHVYRFDSLVPNIRHSVGVILPMSTGLYFVGGQQTGDDSVPEGQKGRVYHTLKVIVVPWMPLERKSPIVPGLVMSANNSDQHVVAKLAMRVTPLSNDADAGIGSLNMDDLQSDLNALKEKEDSLRDALNAFPAASIPAQAQSIAKFINNTPPHSVTGYTTKDRSRRLRPEDVSDNINRAFRDAQGEDQFFNGEEAFSFWDSLRFGALSVKL